MLQPGPGTGWAVPTKAPWSVSTSCSGPLGDRSAGRVDQERPLAEAVLVHVLADGVEQRLRPPTRPEGVAHLRDEVHRRVGDVAHRVWVVVPARRAGRADHVNGGPVRVQDVPTTGQQRLVSRGRGARVVRVELRPPKGADVRLVPDHDVVDRREASHGILGIGAELGSRGVVLWTLVALPKTASTRRRPLVPATAFARSVTSCGVRSLSPGTHRNVIRKALAPTARPVRLRRHRPTSGRRR